MTSLIPSNRLEVGQSSLIDQEAKPGASSVCIIIPSTCELRRFEGLRRAIDSILGQEEVAVRVLVVVNGQRVDPDCFRRLQSRQDIEVRYESEGSSVKAIGIGRDLVREPFFGFLDDDDEYLPGALANRIAPMLRDASIDFVASNGLRCNEQGIDEPFLTDTASIESAPLEELTRANWLASCGGLFRTASVVPGDFDPSVRYFEWTYLAYLLACTRRMGFVDQATFRIHSTPGSLSKSLAYQTAETCVLQKVLELKLPKPVRVLVKAKLSAAHHDAAELAYAQGEQGTAWRHHLRSLLLPGGLRYLAFSRHLMIKP